MWYIEYRDLDGRALYIGGFSTKSLADYWQKYCVRSDYPAEFVRLVECETEPHNIVYP